MSWWRSSEPRVPLGTYDHGLIERRFSLPLSQLRTHIHVMGLTGSGKSYFLAGLFLALLEQGCSATLIDPHGDLARLILTQLVVKGYFRRSSAFRDLIYLDLPNAAKKGGYAPYNVLAQDLPADQIASNILEAMHRSWPALGNGAAPRFDKLIKYGVKLLVSNHQPLPALERLLRHRPFREQLLAGEPDPDIVEFWRGWYDQLTPKLALEYTESTLSRINLLAFSPIMKYSLGQQENLLNFRALIEQNRSLIINLAGLDGDVRRLLGCLLTVSAEQGALSRGDILASDRRSTHYLFIDEFADFSAQSETALSQMLSQTRKYGLFLVMAHQTWSQASERLKGALQNVGVDVAFRLGRFDAEHAARVFGNVDLLTVKHQVEDAAAADRSHPVFYSLPEQWEQWIQAFVKLPARHAYIRQGTGEVSRVKTLSLPDLPVESSKLAAIEDAYLARYFRAPSVEHHVAEVEDRAALRREV